MKWIVFALASIVKILIISALIILSVIVLPTIALIAMLGILLSTIRDHEPSLYNYNYCLLPYAESVLNYLKATWHYLSPQQVIRLQHNLIDRNKTR